MEDYRAIAEQTVNEAKERKECLVNEGFRCHDVCHGKETHLAALQCEVDALRTQHRPRLIALQCHDALAWMDGMLTALQQEVTERQQEVDALNEQINDPPESRPQRTRLHSCV